MDLRDKIKAVSKAVLISWKGWFSKGKVRYSKSTAIKELVNNVLVKLNWVREFGRKVVIQFVFDTTNKTLTITDNFVGFNNPSENMQVAMNIGKSFKNGAILSEHGSGMKSAINFWGKLKSMVTTNCGFDFWELFPNYDSTYAEFATLKGEPFKWYCSTLNEWVLKTDEEYKTGTQMVIDLKSSMLARKRTWFDNIISDLEAAYYEYIGETLEIELVWIREDSKGKESRTVFNVNKRSVLLSSSVSVEGHEDKKTKFVVQRKLDESGQTYNYVDKDKKIGPNMWDFEGTYSHKTGIVVQYQIGRVPEPGNLERHFNNTNNPTYDPSVYDESPFRYGSKYMGLSYCKKWVPISWGGFKQRRDGQEVLGFINILEGIDTVATKDNIVATVDVEEFEKDFSEFLRKRGIYVRGQSVNPKIPESVMEKNLLGRLKVSSKLRKYLTFKTTVFSNQYTLHSGIPDITPINPYKKTPDESIIELKISHEQLWKGIVQGMSYAMECGIKDVLLVSLFESSEFPSDIRKKLDIFEQKDGWNFRYEQYQKLMEL